MEGNSQAHDIENPYIPFATSMSQELDGLPTLSNSCCIYRVPEQLRCVNEKAYTPQLVSIGPLHHGKEGLKDMEEQKKRYLRYFLRRTKVSLEDYVKKIEGKEAELRNCYAHTIELCSDKFVPCMTELHQAGIKFKVRSSKNLFDMCFQDGILEIPNLNISDSTELVLRNLIAFEQCHCDCNYFSDYIVLMDNFVNTPNDVELLVKNGIVENLLGDNKEVSALINRLGKGVVLNTERFYYATLTEGLNNYYRKSWNEWKADLKQKYFKSPWTIISVIAASLIIILTLLQTLTQMTIELSSDEFVRIILVDAAFIIELLLRYCFPIQLESNDRIFNKPWLIRFIIPDMLLLENQLPFFILEDLFATGEVLATMPSVFVLSSIFCMVSTSLYVKRDNSGSFSSFKVEHFVDLIRTLHLPTEEENSKNQRPFETLPVPSMTKLHQAGVKFKASSSNNLFDICFKGRSLEIPNLIIRDDTELVLRNLIAFEQCHCDCNYFSDYIVLMDNFVNTPNDVELLVKNGIVENLLGDNNEVSTLFNSLGKGNLVSRNGFYYATLTKGLNKYYKKPWNKADLKQKYFNSPWRTVSVIAATLIIILTFIQTVCSFFQCAQR